MSVLVDTSIWSLSLRRKRRDLSLAQREIVFRCRDLVVSGEARIIGLIVQEALSGISSTGIFEDVRARLALIQDIPLSFDTFVLAAEFFNVCRGKGVSPEAIDMTICAAAHLEGAQVFTTDPDFYRYERHIPIKLLDY